MEVDRRRGAGRQPLAQINVTPLVDVMLVLLIIFMVTAPMMEKGLDVNLPQVGKAPDLAAQQEPLIVSVTRGGGLAVGAQAVANVERLEAVLKQQLAGRKDPEVFLKADKDVPYGAVVEVMAAVRGAGVNKLGMVAEPK
ncbi:MAG: protein TolR [Desulfuromonadales bacterium GWD2_61_12]|nr:MAG: protein TolR [Desulfuromonadales bacterium GWD2_61_12]HBT82189.1 protein TolR [Desulfuromonas sp.]